MTARLPKPAKWLTGWRRWRVLSRQVRPLLSGIALNAKILEIGGGYNPRFLKSDYPQTHHLRTPAVQGSNPPGPGVAHR